MSIGEELDHDLANIRGIASGALLELRALGEELQAHKEETAGALARHDTALADLLTALVSLAERVTALEPAVPPEEPPPPPPPPPAATGLFASAAELDMDSPHWAVVETWAAKTGEVGELGNQENQHDAVTLARALMWLRTGDGRWRAEVVMALQQLSTVEVDGMKNLALSRNLPGYLAAADLVGYHEESLRAWAREAVDARTWNAFTEDYSLRRSALEIPTNGGAHSRAACIAAALYSGDTALLEEMAERMHDFLGRSGAGWRWSGEGAWMPDPQDEATWRCVVPAGASILVDGVTLSLDGVIPGDQKRAGPPRVPPQKENYVWEGLQGTAAACWMLARAVYPAFEWRERALLRAVTWLHEVAHFPAEGDDKGTPYLVNRAYGTAFPASSPLPGKNAVGLVYPLLAQL